MSNILIFPPAAGQTRTEPPPQRGEAAILFFTGVRYERHTGEGAEGADARTRSAASNRKSAAVGKRIALKKPIAKQGKAPAREAKTTAKASRPRKARA